jgi:ribosomal-protein-alanine N-acetyltransferase
MATAFSFHLGTSTDIPALVSIENRLFDDSDGRLTARNFRYHLQAGNLLLVASDQRPASTPVAGYLLLLIYRKSTRLYSLGVLPDFQNQGVASTLLQQAITHTQSLGKPKMVLEVKTANQAAIALYQRMGFHAKKVVRGYYYDGTDALRMEKVF